MSVPKRHHFVPQMLIKRFADKDGRLHFIDRRNIEAGVQSAKPENLLVERHLYSKILEDGSKDVSLELRYSRLESAIKPLLDQITDSVLSNRIPVLNRNAKKAWDLFVYEQWRRVPDIHNLTMPALSAEAYVRSAVEEYEEKFGPLSTELKEKTLASDSIARFQQSAKVGALSQNHSGKVMKALHSKGLIFGVCDPKYSFVVGSSPVAKVVTGKSPELDDPANEVWLPIHPSIVAALAGFQGQTDIVHVASDQVRRFNEAITKKSSVIVGRSPELIRSLARVGVGTRPSV